MNRVNGLRGVFSELLERKIIGYRYGEHGFDLILDNGDELEVYTGLKDEGGECKWGVATSKRKLVPVENCELARRIVHDVLDNTTVADIDIASTVNGCFVTIAKEELVNLKQQCSKLELIESTQTLC